jgi:glucose-6-phosphate 1-epimerase
MTAQELQTAFGIANVLQFEEGSSGLVRAQIRTAACTATIYLQGAQMTHWQPAGERPVLFAAGRSSYARGNAIRGGVPVIFPWFGAYTSSKQTGKVYPAHGFARTTEWSLTSAMQQVETVQLSFALSPTDESRALGYDHFYLKYTVSVGKELSMELSVSNLGAEPLHFDEALHTYFAVEDVRRVSVQGLLGATYLDSTEQFLRKQHTEPLMRLPRRTDSVFIDTEAACVIHDEAWGRRISVAKTGSRTTVVWNPGEALGLTMADLAEEWSRFVCVETANAHDNGVSLQPGATHTMSATLAVLGKHRSK